MHVDSRTQAIAIRFLLTHAASRINKAYELENTVITRSARLSNAVKCIDQRSKQCQNSSSFLYLTALRPIAQIFLNYDGVVITSIYSTKFKKIKTFSIGWKLEKKILDNTLFC